MFKETNFRRDKIKQSRQSRGVKKKIIQLPKHQRPISDKKVRREERKLKLKEDKKTRKEELRNAKVDEEF